MTRTMHGSYVAMTNCRPTTLVQQSKRKTPTKPPERGVVREVKVFEVYSDQRHSFLTDLFGRREYRSPTMFRLFRTKSSGAPYHRATMAHRSMDNVFLVDFIIVNSPHAGVLPSKSIFELSSCLPKWFESSLFNLRPVIRLSTMAT